VYPDVFWRLDCVGLRGERLDLSGVTSVEKGRAP
jgi:hypothetical protein